jgi:hypothetical protein
MLASKFRELMSEGQSFESPNEYRQRFYSDVVNSAKKVSSVSLTISVRVTGFSSLRKPANKNVGSVSIALPDTFLTTRGFKRRARSFVVS